MTDTYDVTNPAKPTIVKDPNAVLDYTFDWTAWLATDGDAIASATITPDNPLTQPAALVIAGGKVTAWIGGGLAGQTYKVVCHITTSTTPPRQDDRTIYLKIRDR